MRRCCDLRNVAPQATRRRGGDGTFDGYRRVSLYKEASVSQPDHVENTGDNLRHAAEVQEQAKPHEPETVQEQSAPVDGLPDFNT